ncbi:MAG: glycosyltransferase family 2 protein [Pseudomonadota bacterium]
MKVDLCICTYKRSHIADTLRSVARAKIPAGVALRVIVIDNDDAPSAQACVGEVAKDTGLTIDYRHIPGSNISIARNGGLDAATGDWIAFLDDDELVEPDWLTALIACVKATGADAAFGHMRALYGPDAPQWMVNGDFHSQFAARRGNVVETGHTCNALLRWGDVPWRHERFALERGRSGGEDTEFFFRLRALGARYAIADNAIVHEEVPAARQDLNWLLKRRFRIGQSYSAVATEPGALAKLLVVAALKTAYCHLQALAAWPWMTRRAFWLLRGRMHAGVCAGCLRFRQRDLYGDGIVAAPAQAPPK